MIFSNNLQIYSVYSAYFEFSQFSTFVINFNQILCRELLSSESFRSVIVAKETTPLLSVPSHCLTVWLIFLLYLACSMIQLEACHPGVRTKQISLSFSLLQVYCSFKQCRMQTSIGFIRHSDFCVLCKKDKPEMRILTCFLLCYTGWAEVCLKPFFWSTRLI